jgi:hypothetical protein
MWGRERRRLVKQIEEHGNVVISFADLLEPRTAFSSWPSADLPHAASR